jgi:amino acid permease
LSNLDDLAVPVPRKSVLLRASNLLRLDNPGAAFGGDGSFGGAVANLANGVLGAGILAIPFAFHTMGLLVAPVIASLFCWLVCYTLHIIGVFQSHQRSVSYQQVCKLSLGDTHEKVLIGATIVVLTGACIAFMTIIANMLQPQMALVFGADSLASSREFILLVAMCTLVAPCWITSMAKLAPLSLLTVIAMVYLVALLICRSAVQLSEYGLAHGVGSNGGSSGGSMLAQFSGQTFAGLQIFTFAFGCQPTYALIFSDLQQPTLPTMDSVARCGMGMCLLLYAVCGVMGVLYCKSINFRDPITGDATVPDNILAAFQVPNSIQLEHQQQALGEVPIDVTIALYMIVAAVMSSFVQCHFAVRKCLEDLLGDSCSCTQRSAHMTGGGESSNLSDLKVPLFAAENAEGAYGGGYEGGGKWGERGGVSLGTGDRRSGFQGWVFYLEPVLFVAITGTLAMAIPSLSGKLSLTHCPLRHSPSALAPAILYPQPPT